MLRLTQTQARAHILGRHGLSQPYATPLEALHAVFAIQTQYSASLPTALAFRVKSFKPTWHKKEENKTVLKSWTLRHTLHAHTAADFAVAMGAIGENFFLRFCRWMEGSEGLTEAQVRERCAEIYESLSAGALTRTELHEALPALKEVPMAGWGADVKGLAYLGKLKLIVSDGGATRFARHDCGELPDRSTAIAELLRRYFSAYGPATIADFRHWTGLLKSSVMPVFESIQDEFTPVEVEGMPGDRFLHGGLVEGGVPRVNLLAKFDPLTLGHADKTLFLAEKDRTKVFRIAAQVEAGVLVDGKFVGTWRLNRKGKGAEVVIEPFRKIAKARMPGLEREARKAAKSVGLNLSSIELR
ncbi:MAG: AlkZ family DNA glycosylase [Chlorobia bacterium]|nr:AlkZ family DNA glycosylase [Fimbriimonadaceae bacterium]